MSAVCVPVRALGGWCLLRRLVYSALRPPTQPTYRQANTRSSAGGWLVPVRSLLCGVCFAGFFILAAPTHPTAHFAGFCGLLLRAAFAVGGCGSRSPKGQAKHGWLCSTARHIWPAPWGARSAGGRPYPAPVVPPRPILCGLLLRFLLAAPAPRLRFACVAGSRYSHPRPSCRPMGGKGAPPKPPPPPFARFGSLCSPSRPLSPCPMGAQARPLAFAGCFGGLLYSRPSIVGLSLAAVRPLGVRTLVRAPLVFRLRVREKYLSSLEFSPALRGLFALGRALAWAFALPFAAGAGAPEADKNP